MRHWTEIEPKDAVGLALPAEGIRGPVNEQGEPCPWPWEPQQLRGQPIGQYHCRYCGAMVLAGIPHPDYTDIDDPELPIHDNIPEDDDDDTPWWERLDR